MVMAAGLLSGCRAGSTLAPLEEDKTVYAESTASDGQSRGSDEEDGELSREKAASGVRNSASDEEEKDLSKESTVSDEQGSVPGADFCAVADEFSRLYLAFDEDGYGFDQALEAVNGYLEGKTPQKETVSLLEKTLKTYEEEAKGLEEFVLSDALAKKLSVCGISAEEYKAFGNSRKNELYNHIVGISTMLEYLESAEELQESYEDLRFFTSSNAAQQDCMRGYYYYGCFNYWFVHANEAEKAYLGEQVTSRIKAYLPEDPVWYQDQEEVEERVMLYLDELEEINGQTAKHVGQAQEELYGMQQKAEELEEKIEEKQELEEKLARLKEINGRIEEINAEAAAAKEAGDEEKLSALKIEFEAIVAEYEALVAEDTE